MSGIIGKKLGMSVWYDGVTQVPCTVIEAGPCVVTQIKNTDSDGYRAVQLGYEEAHPSRVSKALMGHFKKCNTPPQRKLVEFRRFRDDVPVELGKTLRIEDVFVKNEYIDTLAYAKGKGFQGVVKRHNFAGVGEATHGQHNRQRAPGSIGGCSYPARVFKGMRMAGRMGGKRVKTLNLKVLHIIPQDNVLLLKGAVPGPRGAYVVLQK